MSRNSSISKEDGKIIFISDLEGCAEFSTTSNRGPFKSSKQSDVLCSLEFFERLDQFLREKSGNKVAFLGDYFDKGPLALQSITSIVDLHEKHNMNEDNKKVYIILGNRDLNKLRLPYELQEGIINACSSNSKTNNSKGIFRWGTWETFYKNFLKSTSQSSNVEVKSININDERPKLNRKNALKENNIPEEFKEKLKIILEHSMGALDNPEINAVNESNYTTKSRSMKSNILERTLRNLNGILDFYSEPGQVKFCDAVKRLFNYGKIVEYDPTYKVLMSHGGGMDETIFNKLKTSSDLLQSFKNSTSKMDYFSRIEWFRLELTKPLSKIYNDTSNISSIEELCDNVNLLLRQVSVNTNGFNNFSQTVSNRNNICPEYYLLQAMGLKGETGKPFASFVESCDTPGGCGGPKDSTQEYSTFLKELHKMGVDVISCGHIPQCIPVPLIYKRQTFGTNNNTKLDPIVFILNDTSNGYRPSNIDDVSKVPLSFIQKMGNTTHVGVGLFDNSRMIECNTEKHLFGKNTSTMKPSNKNFACQLENNNLNKFIEGTQIENKHSKEPSLFRKMTRYFRNTSGRDRRYSRTDFVKSGAQPLLLLRNLKQKSNEMGLTAKFNSIVDSTQSLKEFEVLLRTWNIKSKNLPCFINHFVDGKVQQKNGSGKVVKNSNGKNIMIDGCVPFKYIKYTDSQYLKFNGGFRKPAIVGLSDIPPKCNLFNSTINEKTQPVFLEEHMQLNERNPTINEQFTSNLPKQTVNNKPVNISVRNLKSLIDDKYYKDKEFVQKSPWGAGKYVFLGKFLGEKNIQDWHDGLRAQYQFKHKYINDSTTRVEVFNKAKHGNINK